METVAGVGRKGARPRPDGGPRATRRRLRESQALVGPPEAMDLALAERLDAHLARSGVRRLDRWSGSPRGWPG